MKKSWIYNFIFVALIGVIFFVPEAKALLIRGLMEVGLFSPSISPEKTEPSVNLSSFTFKKANGEILNLGDLKGKIIFINFWATWCPPCLAEMPSIEKLYQKTKNDPDVVFVMVEADGNFAKTDSFMKRKSYHFPVYTFDSKLPESIFSGSLPTTLVFDKKGRISMHHVGPADYNSTKFLDFIAKLKVLKD